MKGGRLGLKETRLNENENESENEIGMNKWGERK
jgi:hypothetical protein